MRRISRGCGCVLMLASATLSGCGDAPAPSAPARATVATSGGPGTLSVYNWSDYIAENTVADFQTRSGLRINYDVYSNNETLLQRLAASPGAYDLVFPSARPFAEQLIAGGALQPLDKTKLPNLRNLDPEILAELADIDPDNAHLVPYMWGTTGIGLNVAKVQAALGPDAALDSWDLVFDPTITAKLSSCGIGVLDDALETTSALHIWQGREANDHTPEATAATKRALLAIRPHIRKITGSSELIRDLASGDLCLVLGFSGDVLQARALSGESENPPDIRYVIPREGAVRWVDVMAIPKQSKHADAAHRFIDYLLEPKVIAEISNFVSYANANAASTASIDPAVTGDPGIYPPAVVRAKLQSLGSASAEDTQRRQQAWNAFVFGEM
jgi:putrescine transport system substrate-binding protein